MTRPPGAGEASGAPVRTSELPQLVIELEGQVIQTLALTTQTVTIGRTPGNVLVLPHEAVSRQHAELLLSPEGVVLTDLGSKNGTFVGRVRLAPHQPVRLVPGSVIRIGPFVVRYDLAPAGDDAEAAEERSGVAQRAELAPAPPPPVAYAPPAPPRDAFAVPLPVDA